MGSSNACMKVFKTILSLCEVQDRNVIFSPSLIYNTVGLLAYGSTGATREECFKFLDITSLRELQSHTSQINGLLRSAKPTLYFANSIWMDKKFPMHPSFSYTASSIYKAQVMGVNFVNEADEALKMVNDWIEKETNGLIDNLLPLGYFNTNTRVVYANALYSSGFWKQIFDPSKTRISDFYPSDRDSAVQVPFMTNDEWQYVTSFDGFKVLRLPYKKSCISSNHQISLSIILPDNRDGLDDLILKASSNPEFFLTNYLPLEYQPKVRMGDFRIPKFKVASDFGLLDVLRELNLKLPFNDDPTEVTKMLTTGGGSDFNVYVLQVIQNCILEVDEIGAISASTTVMNLEDTSPLYSDDDDESERVNFIADHPFMFIARDDYTGVVIFTGRVVNPCCW